MKINDLEFDAHHIWHPYTSITHPLPVYPVVGAEKCKIILSNGNRLIDGMSSWWSAIHGYNHPSLNKTMNEQIKKMSHVMFGGITHSPAIKLCRRLISLVPKNLECIFLADSGSVAIEVAIKMAIQYWQAQGKNKVDLLAFKKGYHGDTFGAMSVCDPHISMHSIYQNRLLKTRFIKSPSRSFYEKWENGDEKVLVKSISSYYKTSAALILEPIVQGIGGMNFYHPEYLRKASKLCNKYELLLIADEIATGFGRTGKWFACNHAKITPDILCLGKALTGGTLTLSAIITKRKIAETISNSKIGCFMHGPTFMANPLACAVANTSLALLEDEKWKLDVSNISYQLKKELYPLINHPIVKDVRIIGAIGVVETKKLINIAAIQRFFVNEGVWIRPFLKYIYLVPPYIISSEELTCLTKAIFKSLNKSDNFFY